MFKNKKIFLLIFTVYCFVSCNKNEEDNYSDHNSIPFSYESLTVENDTLFRGQSTTLTAKATGYKLTYLWSASEGPIVGGGSEVMYVVSPCCYGKIRITCEVRSKTESESKSVIITVLP